MKRRRGIIFVLGLSLLLMLSGIGPATAEPSQDDGISIILPPIQINPDILPRPWSIGSWYT